MTSPRRHIPYKVDYSVRETNSSQTTNSSQVLNLPEEPSIEEIEQILKANYAIPENADIIIVCFKRIMHK